MRTRVDRRTVNLSAYPDLVVIYLGMRVNRITGVKTLLGFGPKISSSAAAQPDGLLRHETIIYSLFPMHIGMRQYWRDENSLLQWTRSDPHRQWWQSFLKNSGGTGFWHETYFRRGGIEAVYGDVPENIGLMALHQSYRLADRCLAQQQGPKRNLEGDPYCPRKNSTGSHKRNGNLRPKQDLPGLALPTKRYPLWCEPWIRAVTRRAAVRLRLFLAIRKLESRP